jgi:hypothetical protein
MPFYAFSSEDNGLPELIRLANSAAYRMLSIGDDAIEFANKLKGLREKDAKQFMRLLGICKRLEFVEQLHHSLRVTATSKKEREISYQRDRLTTYLTATCIDIAVGQGFQTYNEWLQGVYEADTMGIENCKAAIRDLSQARTEPEVAQLFVKWTNRIYRQDYSPTMSIRQGFIRFICNLDDWFKEWLFDEYIIQLSDNAIDLKEEKNWETLDAQDKCRRLALYLYDLRNLYTHTTDYYPPMDLGQRIFGHSSGQYMSIVFPPTKEEKLHRIVFLRRGLYESDFIRLFVVFWLRKEWLKISDDRSLLQKYWNRTEYRRLGFSFLTELEENNGLIEAWCSIRLYPYSGYSEAQPLRTLQDTFAKEFIRKHQELSQSSIARSSPDRYLGLIEELNHKITEFNAQHANLDGHSRAYVEDSFVRVLAEMPETGRLARCIQDFTEHVLKDLDVPHY